MNIDYIIVQAGGSGSRLEHLTRNKPKALVPVDNLPMMFYLFKKYPKKRFIIISDYKKEVLHEYLNCFATVKYHIVDAVGKGTCAGLRQALSILPTNTPFLLIWSDLILPDIFELPTNYDNYIGISRTFPCRWSYINDTFVEQKSIEHGIAGFFIFKEKSYFHSVPESGELVRWMKEQQLKMTEWSLAGTREFGLIEEYRKLCPAKCRPFNKVTVKNDHFIKEALDKQGEALAIRECNWYKTVGNKCPDVLPRIYKTSPLEMEYIHGINIYEVRLEYMQRKEILKEIISALHTLHECETVPTDYFSIREAYFTKTIKRLRQVRDLIPFTNDRFIIINGKKCRNIFFYQDTLEKRITNISCDHFCIIHGDCTFSNIMLRETGKPVLIDPRGYFGFSEIYGDPLYDWAKLYYSIVGNYDRFNLKDFRLNLCDNEVNLEIASSGWEDLENEFFELTKTSAEDIKLIHAIIWLSLTTYTWENYDSICAAFYNGLYLLEDIL